MIKRKSKLFICSVICVFAFVLGISFMPKKASASVYYEDLFEGENITSVYSVAPKAIKNFDLRSGLKVTSKKEGATFCFSDIVSGKFQIEYRVFSKTDAVYDLECLRFSFHDANSEDCFTVDIGLLNDGRSWYNTYSNTLVSAVVDTGYGKGYGIDSGTGEITTYGRKINSSYCNSQSESVVFEFDPSSMKLFVGGGSSDCMDLLLDLSNKEQLQATGRTSAFSDFSEYYVDIEFLCFGNNVESASLMVYSIFGNEINSSVLSKTLEPNLYVKQLRQAKVGCEYDLLNSVKVYDLLEGQISFDGSVEVVSPSGNSIDCSNGKFIPSEEGVYGIVFNAKNSVGTYTSVKAYLEVTDNVEAYELQLSRHFENATVGCGASLLLPYIYVENNADTSFCNLSIIKDGNTLLDVTNLNEELQYSFDSIGTYVLTYTYNGGFSVLNKEFTVTVSDDVPTFVGENSKDEYLYCTVFDVPVKSAEFKGNKYDTTVETIFADGRVNAYSQVLLDCIGTVELRYTATIENAVYTYSEFFSVVLSSSDLWVNVSGVNIQNNTDLPDYADIYGNGVLFTATRSGGTVRYKNNIDLSESNLITPILTAMFTPTTYGVKEFTSLQIRLIDAYDESNYVTVLISAVAYGYDYDSSVVCGANKNYEMVGLTTSGTITTTTTTATKIRSTMKGKYDGQYGCIRSLPFAIYFDAKNNAIYAGPKADTTQLSLVADLDNAEHVGMGNEWYGFSTGEVKLEITFNGCLAGTANLTVLDVFGQSMSGAKFNDTVSPYIVLKNFDSADIPNAVVGTEYPIFEGLLYDSADGLLGNVESVIVYYYENGNKKELLITDNKFIPTVSGTYYIEYFGFDNSGNAVVKTVEIQANDTVKQLGYELEDEIENEFFVGETFVLPKGNATGGSGNITVERSLVCGDNTCIIEDESIVLEQAGEYTYIVNISDYLGQTYKFQKSFKVSYSDKPIVKEKLLPSLIIKDKAYTFPEFTAIKYSDNGSESIPVSIFVNGNELAVDRTYTPLSTQPLTVEYRADNWTKSFTVKVNDPSTEKFYLASWFDYDKEEISIEAESLNFIFNTDEDRTTDGKTSFSFINALGTSNAKIEFNVVNNNFEKLNIYITDAANADVRIKLTVEKDTVIGETSIFRINDGYARAMAGSFYSGQTTKPFALYISGQNIYDYDNNLLDYISTTLNGDDFYGFSNDGVYIEFEFEGVVGESSIALKQLWNHSFGDIDGDYISPIVSVDTFSVQPKKGDIVTIPHISVFDVLDSCVDVKLTVSNSNGVVKEYTSGQLLSSLTIDLSKEYKFAVNEYGEYYISIYATDSSWNAFEYNMSFSVEATEKPTLTLESSLKDSYKKGDKITVPKATAIDYSGKEISVYVFIINSCGRYCDLSDGNYVLTETGEYSVVYYAYDEFGNYAKNEYRITVK